MKASESARPRLGIVATRCFPDVGGIEAHVDQLLQRIDSTSWDVDVVVTDCTGRLSPHDTRSGTPIRRHRAYPRARDWYVSPGLFWNIVRNRRELLHIHGVNALVPPVAMLAAIVARRPFVVTLHSGGANTEFRKRIRETQWRVLGLLLRRARAVIAVSRSESESFARFIGRGPIRVVRNGSLELPVPGDAPVDPDHVLSVGRLERYKGHQHAIDALPAFLTMRPEGRLTILGTGPFEDELRERAETLGIADRVTITSVAPSDRAAMARIMAGAGVVTLLSDYEAHPVTIMEALSVGRPVVGRANSGVVELIEDGAVTGVADDADPHEIAGAWNEVAGRPATSVAVPTWDDCVRSVESVYREVLDR